MSDLKQLQRISKYFTILYVEDNAALRDSAKKLLQKFFRRVAVAEDGQDGLEKFKKYRFPIVITDIKMPRLDGISLIREIKKISPKTHIIVISAYDDKENLMSFIDYGVSKFIKKPVSLNVLTESLYQVVTNLREEGKAINSLVQDEESLDSKQEQEADKESEQEQRSEEFNDPKMIFEVLRKLRDTDAKIELHNYYKGLSITNDAKILDVKEDSVFIETSYTQQKAIQFENITYFVSELLPHVVKCDDVDYLSFQRGEIELKELRFTKDSPIDRETVRVYPEAEYVVTVFLGEERVFGDMKIEDISLNAVRLSVLTLPAGLRMSDEIRIEIELEKGLHRVDSEVSILRIDETVDSFHIVFMFETPQRKELMKYITKRQMAIIREFKGMQNG